jgi:hypothetical protein
MPPLDDPMVEDLAPKMPEWEPFKLPNKQDMAFRRTDGFFLRMRKLKSVPGKWLAQIYRDDKILDKGQVIIPTGYDPREFIQKVANYMLDGNSFRYEQDPASGPGQDMAGMPPEETSPGASQEPVPTGAIGDDGGQPDAQEGPSSVGMERVGGGGGVTEPQEELDIPAPEPRPEEPEFNLDDLEIEPLE